MRRPLPKKRRLPQTISRRGLIVGALAAGGLAVGWTLWPREYKPNLAAAPGETIFNGYLKIGRDGHVTVVCPQVEMGQGAYTIIAQIIADELGADWRTVAVEPAPINPLYTNELLSVDWKGGVRMPPKVQATGGSSTFRYFEPQLRRAAAGARCLLTMAAAKRWDANWENCVAEDGFVLHGRDKLSFGELVEEASSLSLPKEIALRSEGKRLVRSGLFRLDIPAKLDGSANFAADVRLPGMHFASIRMGPAGDAKLTGFDDKAAASLRGFKKFVRQDSWLAAIADNSWTAERALILANPKFSAEGGLKSDKDIKLREALKKDGSVIAEQGDVAALLQGSRPFEREYEVGFAPHAALEPMAATAVIENDELQLWIATQSPGLARAAAAKAVDFDEEDVTIHAMQLGGSFGRKYEVEIAAQAAILAIEAGAPVQLTWPRSEDMAQDRMRPAARAKMSARIGTGGRIAGWKAEIATTDGVGEMIARNLDGASPAQARQGQVGVASGRAVDGAIPPYNIAAYAIAHHPADLGIPTGKLRGGAHGPSAFFTESFMDEIARQAGGDPFSYRMMMMGGNVRLANCLNRVTARGGWNGGAQGTNQGLACHSMLGSHIAVLAEARMGEDGRVVVLKLAAVADVGRVMNPDIARQQIEGGLIQGMAIATGARITLVNGVPEPRKLGALNLPTLAQMPEITVELVRNNEAPGGLGELAVPPVAPAIANALYTASGQRFRTLPLGRVER